MVSSSSRVAVRSIREDPIDPDNTLVFDETHDVVVVGFGAAGASAAIQAASDGASVLAIDRFDGGGATRLSGGVIYAGGGSPTQQRAGVTDTVASMVRYLEAETDDSVDPATLHAFCAESAENLAWLESLGVTFPGDLYTGKTTQPPDGYGLYHSGNELQRAEDAPPAPRGHVVGGPGMTGNVLHAALARAARERHVPLRPHTRAVRLLADGTGEVVGVELLRLARRGRSVALHRALFRIASALAPLDGRLATPFMALGERLERHFGERQRVRATGGVVLASGGFVFDRRKMRDHAPRYAGCMPLGTPADVGTGIDLAAGVGAATGEMASCAASRFLCPPEAFVSGVLVNARGERFCDESLYGATLSKAIAEQPAGVAYLVIDRALWTLARAQMENEDRLRGHRLSEILSGKLNHLLFRKWTAWANLHVNRVRSVSVDGLARRCGMDAATLRTALEQYRAAHRGERDDPMGKDRTHLAPLTTPPYYAIRCALSSKLFPGPCITLGGLRVDGRTGEVQRDDGTKVDGLYAAGRAAVGISSRSYVSGLSLADCIFSGRNCGRAAAVRARHRRTDDLALEIDTARP